MKIKMSVGKISTLTKKGEPKIATWAVFPDGDLIDYFEYKSNEGFWDWRKDLLEVPELSQVWLTSSHVVRNESIVNSSVSFLVSLTRNDTDMCDLPQRIFEALENQGPTRNPTFNRKHSALINSIIAKQVATMPRSNEKWITNNMYIFRIPIYNFEYDVKNNTEEELLRNQIIKYFEALKKRTSNQNHKTLFKMYSFEWINWILFALTINSIFEKIYYNKLYRILHKLPKETAKNLINNSPGCLKMLTKMWNQFWFNVLHFGQIVLEFIDADCGIDFFQEYPEIIRSYDILGHNYVKTDYDPEFCGTSPSLNEITNFLHYHKLQFPQIPRNYALEKFITTVSAMMFFNEDRTIQEIQSTYGTKVCKLCKKSTRKIKCKEYDKTRRQKNKKKEQELPELIKRNDFLLKEIRTLNDEINKAKSELQIIQSACSNFNK